MVDHVVGWLTIIATSDPNLQLVSSTVQDLYTVYRPTTEITRDLSSMGRAGVFHLLPENTFRALRHAIIESANYSPFSFSLSSGLHPTRNGIRRVDAADKRPHAVRTERTTPSVNRSVRLEIPLETSSFPLAYNKRSNAPSSICCSIDD